MTDCTHMETLMTEVLSGSADEGDRLRLENHCDECISCRTEFDVRSVLMRRITTAERPDPGEAFWAGYLDGLEKRMAQERVDAAPGGSTTDRQRQDRPADVRSRPVDRLRRLLSPLPAWSLQLAAAVLLVSVGIAIGRQSPDEGLVESVPGDPRMSEQQAEQDARHAALEQHALDTISRSRTLLLGLVNFDPATENPASLDIPTRRAVARRLADDAGALKGDLVQADRRRLSELISDLEIILLQIANLEANADIPEIEILQSSVDRGAIMFKIDVEQMRRTGGLGTPSDPGPPGSGHDDTPATDPAV